MLEIDVLVNKRISVIKNSQVLDLISSSLNRDIRPSFNNYVIVPSDGAMRPDLIAHTSLGRQAHVGVLLKSNGISNPFSIEAGEILYLPSAGYLGSALSSGNQKEQESKNRSFRKELQSKVSKVSEERLEYLKSKSISESVLSNPLPPNITEENESSVDFVDGKIVFGSNIGICRSKLNSSTSTTQLKSKLIEKKIFKGS